MFGVVPKKIWNKLLPADESNLVPMETNLFVLKAEGKNILLDCGLGDCLSDPEKKIYAVDSETGMESGLSDIGLTADDIDIVFLSHLHTDHAGGAVKQSGDKYVPRFKNAEYKVQKDEWNDALNPNERTSAVYIPERLKPIDEAGQLRLIEGEAEIVPGVKAILTGGHTPGHQAIEAISGETLFVYYADIIPFTFHVRIPYVAGVDLDPLTTMEVKRKLIPRLLASDNMIAFDHDVNIRLGKLYEYNGKIDIKNLV